MKHLLHAKGLWVVVDGTEEPAEEATAATCAEFQKKSQKAFSTVVLAISTSQPGDIMWAAKRSLGCPTQPFWVWYAGQQTLPEEAVFPDGDEGRDFDREASKAHEGVDRPASSNWCSHLWRGSMVTLLGSLPKSYSRLVTTLEVRVDGISLNYVQQALVHEEQKMRGQGHSSNPDEQKGDAALVGESKKIFKPHKPPICFGCNQPGHFRQDCLKAIGTKKSGDCWRESQGTWFWKSWCICGIKG